MTERLTHAETEQFYDLTSDFSEYDPGLDAFSDAMRRAESALSSSGGKDSNGYRETLNALNQEWDYYDQPARVSGKVYVLEDGLLELSEEGWEGPHRDESGVYFIVDNAALVSLGVIDRYEHEYGDVSSTGEHRLPVELAYAFTTEDMKSDQPIFYARPDDILSARYEMPTLAAVDGRLHHKWPKFMESLDRRIDAAGFDPMKLVTNVRSTVERFQDTLTSSEELRLWLGKYLHARFELDTSWPYGVTMQGDISVIEQEGDIRTITLREPSLQYVKAAGIDIEYHKESSGSNAVSVSIVFHAPVARTQGEYIDSVLSVPLQAINSVFSTRPMGSITESIDASEFNTADNIESVEPVVCTPDTNVRRRTPSERQIELERLAEFKRLLRDTVKQVTKLRSVRHATQEDALVVSSNIATWFHEQVKELDLQRSDMLRLSGEGVVRPNGKITETENSFHIDLDAGMSLISPTIAADTYGLYDGVVAEVVRYEEEDGTEYWQISPKLGALTQTVHKTLSPTSYPLLVAKVETRVLARLDGSASFEFPELDKIQKQRDTLGRLALGARNSQLVSDMRAVDQLFYAERSEAWSDASASVLKRLRRVADYLNTDTSQADGIDALRAQLQDRTVTVTADTWIGEALYQKHAASGIIAEVFVKELANENVLVAALQTGAGGAVQHNSSDMPLLIDLRTVRALRF